MLLAIILASCSMAFPSTSQVSIQGRGGLFGSDAISISPLPPVEGCSDPPTTAGIQQRQPSSNGDDLLAGSREFALKLFKSAVTSDASSGSPDNVFMSPVSVWLALVSTYFGARGETASQLASLLTLPATDLDQLAADLTRLRARYDTAPSTPAGNTLRLANRYYFDRGLALCPKVVDRMGGSDAIQRLDFAGTPDSARQTVNSWVSSVTDSKIRELLSPGDVTTFTRMVLANAAYFKGAWSVMFDAKSTHSRKFYTRPEVSGEAFTMVPMMKVRDTFAYLNSRSLHARFVELPFSGGDLSFFAAIPLTFDYPIDNLVSRLSVDVIREALSKMSAITMTVSLPRLRIESAFDLSDTLTTLGAGNMFDRARSDLSGFASGNQPLDVGVVRHKAFLEINEVGAEAAAATGIVLQTYSAIQDDVLTFNRPFVFFIRDNRLDSILFVGLVRKPPTVQ